LAQARLRVFREKLFLTFKLMMISIDFPTRLFFTTQILHSTTREAKQIAQWPVQQFQIYFTLSIGYTFLINHNNESCLIDPANRHFILSHYYQMQEGNKRTIGVVTPGGDAAGTNAALRAITRIGLHKGFRILFIREGFGGMVQGSIYFQEANWYSVMDIIQRGGTILGSARTDEFHTREQRMRACKNLIISGVTDLICIGGDGSLTAAHIFYRDWPGLVSDLVANNELDKNLAEQHLSINVVGIVSSIHNDFPGTDMSIGVDTALHRIVESIDAVDSTAKSHRRSFVIEVMGRWSGYLALVAALTTEADWLFLPEWPAPVEWPDMLCNKLKESRAAGQRMNIIICSEGAQDCTGERIRSEQVRDVIAEHLQYDVRVTVLGHVQRGGIPSAYDRLLATRMGAEAVFALMDFDEPIVIALDGNSTVRRPLSQCVERILKFRQAMEEKNWQEAMHLRGRSFLRNLNAYRKLAKIHPHMESETLSGGYSFNLAVMHIGSPSCGMNAAVRTFVRYSICHKCRVYTIKDSFEGLLDGRFEEMDWNSVNYWTMYGGSFLGSQKSLPSIDLEGVARRLAEFHIHALLMVGGFEAFHSCLIMAENRHKYAAFCIPMAVIPCTISNNIPGTDLSLGCDTALNEICEVIDKLKQSAIGTKKRVFIVETMGGYCGFLATLSALCSGADNAYIFEEKFTIDDMKTDVQVIFEKITEGEERYIVTRSQYANENYTTQFIKQLYSELGKGKFSTRVNVLGHFQQGGNSSPFDRLNATRMTIHVAQVLISAARDSIQQDGSVYTTDPNHAVLLGIVDQTAKLTPVEDLKESADFEHRMPVFQNWLRLHQILRILARHDCVIEASSKLFQLPHLSDDSFN
ncbi:6-phosphofructokinase, partial [Trichinella pseudospiralis]